MFKETYIFLYSQQRVSGKSQPPCNTIFFSFFSKHQRPSYLMAERIFMSKDFQESINTYSFFQTIPSFVLVYLLCT